MSAPTLFPCNPLDRAFPPEWKDVWFRRHAVARSTHDGTTRYEYECPVCRARFDHAGIGYLQGDHVWPYSLFGETSWENYRLICGRCNAARSNRLAGAVRRCLGTVGFRSLVAAHLRAALGAECIAADVHLRDLLAPHER